jgi:hypothetical protein
MSDWRVIGTDSENDTGVAPICLNTAAHGGPHPDVNDTGVYDCCPGPHIECGTTRDARAVADALTAADAEICS